MLLTLIGWTRWQTFLGQNLGLRLDNSWAWVPDMAKAAVSMRSLLRKASALVWTTDCEVEFMQTKAVLADKRFIKPFDPNLYKELLVDTCKVAGAGYILIQRCTL